MSTPFVAALAIDPSDLTIVYAGTEGGGIFKSTDGGTSWTVVNTGLPSNASCAALAVHPTDSAIVYAVATGIDSFRGSVDVYKSVKGGTSWAVVLGLPDGDGLAIAPSSPTILYAGKFTSTDGGTSWTPTLPSFFALTPLIVGDLAVDPGNAAVVYASTGIGVLRSTDGGKNWASLNQNFPTPFFFVKTLALDLQTGTNLHVGTEGDGVFNFQIGDRPPEGILAFFESPESEQAVSGITVIRGWAVATQDGAHIGQVRLLIDGNPYGDIPCCSERGDVLAFLPQFPAENALQSGWGTGLNWGLLDAGSHSLRLEISDAAAREFFISANRIVSVVSPGGFEFLDQFALTEASASLEGNELVLAGVTIRDKETQQQKEINARFRWVAEGQSFGMVEAETVTEVSSWQSRLSSLFASLLAGFEGMADSGHAHASPGITAFFESPQNGQTASGVAVIRGWAVCRGSRRNDYSGATAR